MLIESISTSSTGFNCADNTADNDDTSARRNRLVCHQCAVEFRNVRIFAAHAPHCLPGPYRCHVCTSEYSSVPQLVTHKLTSHKEMSEPLFLCCVTTCSARFRTYPAFLKHLATQHPPPTRTHVPHLSSTPPSRPPLSCQHCRKVFVKKIYLTHHQMRHHAHLLRRDFVCEVCGAQLGSSSALSVHVNSVHGSLRFRCHLCPRVFTRRDRLRHHCRLHSGEKPFQCWLCDKAFLQRCKLNEHVRRHRGEKRFRCSQCGKQYAANTDLRSHLRRIHGMDLINRTHTIQPISACLRPLKHDVTECEPIAGTGAPIPATASSDVIQTTPTQQFPAIVAPVVQQPACSRVFPSGTPVGQIDSVSCQLTPTSAATASHPQGVPGSDQSVEGSNANVILLQHAPTFSYLPIG